ncbi:hypothetical protein HU200_011820 [Digitaria exilis]|uniref:C2 domain-containing protein n=1 Tax=Digitaria exilis TaxID=1010633 RepID=A0A835FG48_9POAL|nr:hypothetical protein HU200_011820 [Digitaria exilis]
MASRFEVEVTVGSASNLKNVNWRNGELQPYAVLWVDDGPKCSTRVDSGEDPVWDDKVLVPIPPSSAARLEDAVLYLDVVHAAGDGDDVKPLVGSARLPLRDVLDDAGVGAKVSRSLRLKRPSGRPQGRIEVRVAVREAAPPPRYNPYPAAAYSGSGQPPPYYAAPPAGYPAAAAGGATYGAAPPPPVAYGAAAPQTKSKMGMGTGLAVGAAAGLLGGLALAEGASYLEDKFEDNVADKVEDNLYGDGDGDGGYDDDY